MATTHGRIFFNFGYNKVLMDEIRCMEGAQYHGYEDAPNRDLALMLFGKDKLWSVKADSDRNQFQLAYLQGGNPYSRWEREPVDFVNQYPLRDYQKDITAQALAVHSIVIAGEMGIGKSLCAFELMIQSGHQSWWWVGPKSAIKEIEYQMKFWKFPFQFKMMTYNKLVTRMKEWDESETVPRGIVFDECQKLKTPTSQRSQAGKAIADGIREHYGEDGFILLMSGTPAPNNPADWWMICEIACPGFLKEGTQNKFKFNLGLFEKKESFAGGSFNQKVTWLDDEKKCESCGKFENDIVHSTINPDTFMHDFKPSINEVARLYKRMHGLVVVKFKRDCLDLPDKQYRVINIDPLPSTIRAAKLIAAKTSSAAKTLILLRELSDGFQYREIVDGDKECGCKTGKVKDFEIKSEFLPHYNEHGIAPFTDEDAQLPEDEYREKYYNKVLVICPECAGTKRVPKFTRTVERTKCPKDDVLADILDEHHDIGRLVVYAGFQGSIERCVEIAQSEGWTTIAWYGKGLTISDGVKEDPLVMFQEMKDEYPRVCFIGHPESAGTGLTLTASPTIFYYSNDFNGANRIQSEDRIHRIGMDENRGATIIDVIHLPTDRLVLNKLKEKRDLQNLSMGQLLEALESEKLF